MDVERRPDGDDRPPASEFTELVEEIEAIGKEVDAIVEGGSSGIDLVPTTAGQPAAARREMERTRQLLATKEAEMQERLEQMESLMRREMAAARQRLAPLERHMQQLSEGIWMVNLYLGRSEEIVRLADGKPAPAEEPIHIRQLVLSMDEECAVAAEDGGIDVRDIEAFDNWLTEDPAHLDQVLPEIKGVVGLRARARNDRDYGGPYVNTLMKEKNEHTYFLIRNGERVYRLWTDFSAGERMIPTAKEFTDFFRRKSYNFNTREYDVEDLDPESIDFEKAEAQAEAHQRHYMRMGLVLQGLVERTTVFHPLPGEKVSFLTPESHERGEVVFILDGERTIGSGREPFLEWQRRLNGQLEVGMRIVGTFYGNDFREADDYPSYSGHSRLHPDTAKRPESLAPHVIETKTEGGFIIRYDRGEILPGGYYSHEPARPAKVRASCRLRPTDRFILPLDLVEVDELQEYLVARLERAEYSSMFPLIKAVIRVKEKEAAAEEPFRRLLEAEISRTHNVSVADAAAQIPRLTSWWKRKNRQHRPLVGDDDAKALREIVNEFGAQLELDRTVTPAGLFERLQSDHPDALLIARTHKGRHVVLEPENEEGVFVARHEYTRTGRPSKVERWKLPSSEILRWRVFYESPRWKRWRRGASLSDHLTGPELDQTADQLRERHADVVAITYRSQQRTFEIWTIPASLEEPPSDRSDDQFFLPSEPMATFRIVRWKRTTGGRIDLTTSRDERRIIGDAPWRPDARRRYGETRSLLYESRERISTMVTLRDEYRERRKAFDELHARGRSIAQRIEDAWLNRAENALREAFILEYSDMSLWEGHRKTIADPSFPHSPIARDIGMAWVVDGEGSSDRTTVGEMVNQVDLEDEIPEDLLELVINLDMEA